MAIEPDNHRNLLSNQFILKRLTADQVQQIDSVVESVGDYGEVHLIIQHGQLRYINKVESFKAWLDSREPKR